MITKDVRKLLEKLNDHCTRALESAVGACVGRTHYEVRWEHVLLELLDCQNNDIAAILNRFQVESGLLKRELQTELEALRTGNTGKPSFSPPFLDALEMAWSFSSLNFGLDSITSGTLLIAALEQGQFGVSSYANYLRAINVETLKNEFFSMTRDSTEHSGTVAGACVKAGSAPAGVLEQFCTNFTTEARSGKIDPILGRDEEIRQALDILNRRRKNNPILVGEAGVGKTAIVEGLALRIAAGDVPEQLKKVDLWGLDLGLLQAGASVKGEFEKRLKNVIDAIKNSATPAILFIDEAHTLIGAGGAAGQNDAANLLKPALARGELRTLAATTWSEYRKYFEKDPALARRFQLVKIEEPDEQRCCSMLQGIARSYEKHHQVLITSEGIRAAVAYSHRYISGRQLPDKAVDVLDTASARVKTSQSAKPAALDNAQRLLFAAGLEQAALVRDRDAGIAIGENAIEECAEKITALEIEIARCAEQWEKEKVLALSVIKFQKELLEAREKNVDPETMQKLTRAMSEESEKLAKVQARSPMVFPHVSAAVCAQVISDWTGIPVGSMVKDEAEVLLQLESRLGQRVIGQDTALCELANAIRASKTGMGNPDSPIGVFLFTGPSGVGKTECGLALADAMFGGEKFLTVINMSEYQERHTVSQLKGSPPGYVGYGEGGILTEAVRQKPYSVVLLDEVEKADIEVMNLFYQVFDKGFMRDGEGREISFRNTIIIMTSNLASEAIDELCTVRPDITDKEIVEAIRPRLSSHFRPALLARCRIVPFRPLSEEVLRSVVGLKLDRIAQRLKDAHKIRLSCSPELLDRIASNCTAAEAGARNADTVIDQLLLPSISRQLLMHLGEAGKTYSRIHVGATPEGEFEIAFSEAEDLQGISDTP